MLQNNPIASLQNDNIWGSAQQDGKLIRQTTHVIQPKVRLPLPVATIGQNLAGLNTFLPQTGYEILRHLPSVHIEQTFELNDSLTAVTSNNHFVIRSPLNEAIFAGSENSSDQDRKIWGSARSFQLHLIDQTHQEILVLRKKFALGLCCGQQSQLEVWMPPGYLIGSIKQSKSFLMPQYFIMEDNNDDMPILCIEGDKMLNWKCLNGSNETYFRVHSGGDLRASINRKWSSSKLQYCLNVYFSDNNLTAKDRALILSGAFLMNYLYFQKRW